MRRLIFLILLLGSLVGYAQNNTPTYTWRMHLPYNSVRQIVEADQKLFILADVGIYEFGLKSGEAEFLTKVNGFSESNVVSMGYSSEFNTLVIAYKSGDIDLLKGNSIINLPGIKRSTIFGSKDIYEVYIYNQYAYLSTAFGIVVIDLVAEEIIDDYQNLGLGGVPIAVNSLAIFNEIIYIGTNEGIKYAPGFDNNVNLKNFSSWETINQYDSAVCITDYNNKLYFVSDSILYSFDGLDYSTVESGVKKGYKNLNVCHGKLVVCRYEGIAVITESGLIEEYGEVAMSSAILDFQNNLWFGGFYRGLMKKDEFGQISYFTPQGPFASTTYDMEGQGNSLWVTSGGYTPAFAPTYNSYGYYRYEDGNWFNRNTSDPLAGGMRDFTALHVPKDKNETWLGSFGSGLLKLENGKPVERYTNSNSALKVSVGTNEVALGMAYDNQNNLWVSNYETDRSLAVMRPNGDWVDFNVGTKRLGEMVVDERDQIWILVPRTSGSGILVAKEFQNGSLRTRFLGTSKNGGGLPSNNVKAIVQDKDGEIWVGTESGIAVFYNPSLVFEGGANADAQQIIIDDGEDIGYLLGSEVVNDIKIDGGNRKWVATNNGAWLIKEDGSEVVLHLTEVNSPLPSNVINCIGIIPNTGEVFFGTTNGIASFRSDATEAQDLHKNSLVFPNPVHPEYDGPITITGLPEDATVKIADVAGRVVYELVAVGGTAVWDGLNFDGKKPQTGVYLIFSANKDDEDSLVSKLLIVR
jgi:ligand-binding sensor domain-containing protein